MPLSTLSVVTMDGERGRFRLRVTDEVVDGEEDICTKCGEKQKGNIWLRCVYSSSFLSTSFVDKEFLSYCIP